VDIMAEMAIPMHCFEIEGLTEAALLACEEALLDARERESGPNLLWFWEPRSFFVVGGYSRSLAADVDMNACLARHIPVLRRCSGGGTVLQGPGCLNYGLVLQMTPESPWHTISQSNAWIMNKQRQAVAPLLQRPVEIHGVTDLTLDNRKFSGNAQRRRRRFLMFHGCFLLQLDLSVVEAVLRPPSLQPQYRHGRTHGAFLVNLQVPAEAVKKTLRQAWNAVEVGFNPPVARIEDLVRTQYTNPAWINRAG
jgi:lipoate---protein ligase